LAGQHLQAAVDMAAALVPQEPGNSKWLEYQANAHLSLAQYLLGLGKTAQAAEHVREGCDIVRRRLSSDSTLIYWRYDYSDCLDLRAQLAMAGGDLLNALAAAKQQATIAASMKSGDPLEGKFIAAQAQRLIGDIEQRAGDPEAAKAAWRQGLGGLPSNASERPWESKVRADLLARLGDPVAARHVMAALTAAGIVRADILKA
jgi:tetratricopeptide (TPR) repeat protein